MVLSGEAAAAAASAAVVVAIGTKAPGSRTQDPQPSAFTQNPEPLILAEAGFSERVSKRTAALRPNAEGSRFGGLGCRRMGNLHVQEYSAGVEGFPSAPVWVCAERFLSTQDDGFGRRFLTTAGGLSRVSG